MPDCDVQLADLNDHQDGSAIVEIINAYACEPQGGGAALPNDVLEQIIPLIRGTPGAFVMLARISGQPAGAAVCFRGFSTFAAGTLVNVHDLSVLAPHRGSGIGTQLLHAVEAHARQLGCKKVTLEVRDANPHAERLYRRLGYGDPSGFPTKSLEKPLS